MLAIVSGSILYFTIPGNFEAFQETMFSLAPLIFFAFALLIKIKLARTELRTRSERQETDLEIRLTIKHKIWYDMGTSALPVVMLAIVTTIRTADYVDAILALVAYLFMWALGKIIFAKKNIA